MELSAMALYMVTNMITPGPHNLTTMYLSARYGLWGARKFVAASALCLLCKTLLCGGLNVLLADLLPQLIPWLKWLGAAYMLYLACTMAMSGFRADAGAEERQSEGTYAAGALVQLLNMKSWVGALTLFAVYVVPHTTSLAVIAAVSCAFVGLMLCSSLLWGGCGSALRRVYRRYRKPFGIAMGLSLLYCAVTAVL